MSSNKLPSPDGLPVEWCVRDTKIRAQLIQDDFPDLSYLGEWTTKQGEQRANEWVGALEREHVGRNEYPRFIPQIPEYGAMDMARMESHGETWACFGVVLTVYAKAFGKWVDIGSASTWGVDVAYDDNDDSRQYLAEIIHEMRHEAVHEARETLSAKNHI